MNSKADRCGTSRQPLNPAPDERVCFNCNYCIWAVALGFGGLCKHPANPPPDRDFFQIPSRRYTCDHFEPRDQEP